MFLCKTAQALFFSIKNRFLACFHIIARMLILETTVKDLFVQEMCLLSAIQDRPTIIETRLLLLLFYLNLQFY